ncbi:hypothetical protein [Marinifilum sp. D737]|uniref:hypothetical protein n=1 Tax=Marinifilum sp. D737 TaxID=2969628 RepID=UPI002274122A|nr:hypothetical protein [Marinifilum sp. D737]MCY1633792.1 hypothetical protein [Marinifilum sp. D737]
MKRIALFIGLLLAVGALNQLAAQKTSSQTKCTIGTELDLFPYVSNGYYASAWLGLDDQQVRFRSILAKSDLPDFMLDDEFNRNTLKAYAVVVDYFFKPNYKGVWLGSGFEYWDGELEDQLKNKSGYHAWVYTLGAGYVMKIWDNLYVNPWIAGHLRIAGSKEVRVGNELYKPDRFTPEISIKLGYHF